MSRIRLAATCYHEQLGWCVIPVDGKRPLPKITWAPPPAFDAIEHRFDDPQATGLAVLLGAASGNLAARDFDTVSSYDNWAVQYPELASKLPTVATARGHHVYARTEIPCKTSILEDGELRGQGAYVVMPPSEHPEGPTYTWVIDPFREIPIVDPSVLIGGAKPRRKGVGDEARKDRQHALQTHEVNALATPNTCNPTQHIACVNSDKKTFIQWAIDQTVPLEYGTRHRRVFDFARLLLRECAKATDSETLRVMVERWHQAALPNIRTKAFSETWRDFQTAWSRIERPAGANLATVMAVAEKDDYSLGTGNINHDKVARLMRSAALGRGGGDFFMDYRTIGNCVGLSPRGAQEVSRKLINLGLLMIIRNGTIGTRGRATEWRWLGPLA